MPLVACNDLPAFEYLRKRGQAVLPLADAEHQDIRELHIGLLNMMPDKALEATERQFLRLVGESNPIAQFYVHLFTLPELERGEKARVHIDRHYLSFEQLSKEGLDALIITGANVVGSELADQPFWFPLKEVIEWAGTNVTSTLCSCLATHAVLQFRYGQKRIRQPEKIWGVFPHKVVDPGHPLVNDCNTRFYVPHSRWNAVTREHFDAAGLRVLVESDEVGIHLATSADGLQFVFFQGHPEYDTVSLLKEYKREVFRYAGSEIDEYPPFPKSYFKPRERAILEEYLGLVDKTLEKGTVIPPFPDDLIIPRLDNIWHDTGEAIVGNWIGGVYQVTNAARHKPFLENVNPNDPLNLNRMRS